MQASWWVEKNNARYLLYEEDEDNNIPIRELNDELKDIIKNRLSNINFGTLYWEIDVQQRARDLLSALNDKKIDYYPRAIRKYLRKELG